LEQLPDDGFLLPRPLSSARRTILDRLSNRLTEIIAKAKSLGHR